ncbi:MAG: DedA family protein [Burkholderiales bacterium]
MDPAHLLQAWGYPAVLVGTFLEGETVLLLAGFAAHAGYLELPWVIAAAFTGSTLGEQFYFLLGRRYGERLLARFPRLQRRAGRVRELLARHQTGAILSMRFLYGLRTVGPMAIGASGVPWLRFSAIDSVAALAWAGAIASAGYVFGRGVELWLGELRKIEGALAATLIAAGACMWWLRLRKLRS